MHLWRAVVSSQPTQTGDENHNRDKERDAQEVVEVVVNKARISQWFDGEPVEPVKEERGHEDWIVEVPVAHRQCPFGMCNGMSNAPRHVAITIMTSE